MSSPPFKKENVSLPIPCGVPFTKIEYLSWSKDSKTALVISGKAEVTSELISNDIELPDTVFDVNCFVIFNLEFFKSTDDTLGLGSGENNLPEPTTTGAPANILTVRVVADPTKFPSNTPVTLGEIAANVRLVPPAPTDATLLYVSSLLPGFKNLTVEPFLKPVKFCWPAVTVVPFILTSVIPPGNPKVSNTASDLNWVNPVLAGCSTDFIPWVLNDVIIPIVLEDGTPFTLISSPITKSPPVWFTLMTPSTPAPALTEYPAAPLFLPSI